MSAEYDQKLKWLRLPFTLLLFPSKNFILISFLLLIIIIIFQSVVSQFIFSHSFHHLKWMRRSELKKGVRNGSDLFFQKTENSIWDMKSCFTFYTSRHNHHADDSHHVED